MPLKHQLCIALLTCTATFQSPAAAQEEPKRLVTRVNFIANEGLLLLAGEETAVLIDALFRESVEPYARIPAPTLDHMETAQEPFDKVKLVLITHKHADHFSAPSVARFMEHNAQARLVSSQQVIDELKAAAPNYEAIAERVSPVAPAGADAALVEVEGIKVHALALSHGGGEMEAITNLGYIVEISGKRLLHVGDAQLNEKTTAPLIKHAVGVDTACVPYWWILEKDGREFLDRTLKPVSIVAIHVPPAEAETITQQIHVHMPEVTVFSEPWRSKRL